jgi:nucleoid-associated protein YgaU
MPVPYRAIALVSLPLFLAACAPKQQVMSTPQTAPQAAATVSPNPTGVEAAAAVTKHYIVKRGDNLWAIAGRGRVYGDPFAWPLLYKANRDQIQDPDRIFPKQDLSYRTGVSSEDLRLARATAFATPAYSAKRKRKSLPLG